MDWLYDKLSFGHLNDGMGISRAFLAERNTFVERAFRSFLSF
jgi:hypothetical protein